MSRDTLKQARAALQRACDVAGGQLALANKLKIRQSTLWSWLRTSKTGAAAEYVIRIEAATGIPRGELRPDLYPERSVA